MTITPISVDAVYLTDVPGLDPIHVFWQNVEPGKGYCTITCYGSAWTVYFGAMNGQAIQKFFTEGDVDYLTGKMSPPKSTRLNQVYLKKVIEAVKYALNLGIPKLGCVDCGTYEPNPDDPRICVRCDRPYGEA